MKRILSTSFLFFTLTTFSQNNPKSESLTLAWPESENWKVAREKEDTQQHLLEIIHKKETLKNWTEMGSMIAVKEKTGVNLDVVMNQMYAQALKNTADAKLTFIEKNETTTYPWIIFMIEAPAESQVWYVRQGKYALYLNYRAVKKPQISKDLKKKLTEFFKAGEIVNL